MLVPQMQYRKPAVPACLVRILLFALASLMLAPASAEPLAVASESLHAVNVRGENNWQLSSFQQNLRLPKEAWALEVGDDEVAEMDRLLGLSFRSSLPISGMTSTLEYAFSQQSAGLADAADTQLLQLRVEHRWQSMHYGLRYFSVGEDFGVDPLAQRTLSQHGLAAAGQGGELWLDWRLSDITVRPSARITAHADQENSQHLALMFTHSQWQIGLHSLDQAGAVPRLSRGITGNFRLRQDEGHLPAMHVGLSYRNQAELADQLNQLEASLQFRKRLFRSLNAGAGTSVAAGLSYRREERPGAIEQGLGVNLTVQLDLGAG